MAHIMPGHPCTFEDRDDIICVLIDLLEVEETSVIIILSREKGPREISWVHIRKWVIMRVPSSKAQVDSANACPMIIHDYELDRLLDA